MEERRHTATSLQVRVAIIGAGPAGLMAAETLATAGIPSTLFDQMPSPGRKFLLAGRGGLNLTHSEPSDAFLARYGERADDIRKILQTFDQAALRTWADGLGAETFIGSSGRVFPRAMKASPLLRAWLRRLEAGGARLRLRHRWTGWTECRALRFETPDGVVHCTADAVILALGGASWPKLGSNGDWAALLRNEGVIIAPFRPANAGASIRWSTHFISKHAGVPLKNALFRCGDAETRGDAIVTEAGLEGGPVYALCATLRKRLDEKGAASLGVDLRPHETLHALARRISALPSGASTSERLRRGAHLAPVAQSLVREAFPGVLARDPVELAHQIKNLVLPVHALSSLERAISTAGGIPFEALDSALMVRALPGVFAAGEMLDWEAPTGGYLLQATLAGGVCAARSVLSWLAARAIASPP